MNIDEIREYCLTKPGVTEGFPFNDTALVFKVAGKMFALLDLSKDSRGISLKCDPERAIELREQHQEVTPAWHFNKVMAVVLYCNRDNVILGRVQKCNPNAKLYTRCLLSIITRANNQGCNA
jgi:predicted DNA-binding protein (MmcQ/YjbR family)